VVNSGDGEDLHHIGREHYESLAVRPRSTER
jgi:hypothetical protein